jgi:hypothetical protein
MAPHNLPKNHATCHQQIHSRIYHITTNSTLVKSADMSHAMCEVRPYHIITCTDCTINEFLPIWQIEQNAISHSSDVRLTQLEVCWVRDDEDYAPVHFEVILNTFIFGPKVDPWSKF